MYKKYPPYLKYVRAPPCEMQMSENNNNNNNQICKAPECQKTSVALADRNSRAN